MPALSKGLKTTILYGVGTMSMRFISLLMVPIMTYYLTPAEFGTLEVLLTVINLVSIVMACGLTEAIYRYYDSNASDKSNHYLLANINALAYVTAISLACPLIGLSHDVAYWLPGNVTSTQIILLGIALIVGNLLGIHYAFYRIKNYVVHYVGFNIFRAVLQACLVLYMLLNGYGVTGIIIATCSSSLLTFLLSSTCFIRRPVIATDLKRQQTLIRYGLPLIISGMASFVLMGLDKWWLAYKLGTADMAMYALAMKFALITLMLLQPAQLWWQPKRMQLLQTVNQTACRKHGHKIVALGFILASAVAIAAKCFIYIAINQSYYSAIGFLPWMSFIWAFKNMGDTLNGGCYLHSTSSVMVINVISAVLAVIGFYTLLPIYQSWGAVYVLLIVFFIRAILFIAVSESIHPIHYQYGRIAILGFISFVGTTGIFSLENIASLMLLGGLFLGALTSVALAFGLFPPPKQWFETSASLE